MLIHTYSLPTFIPFIIIATTVTIVITTTTTTITTTTITIQTFFVVGIKNVTARSQEKHLTFTSNCILIKKHLTFISHRFLIQ